VFLTLYIFTFFFRGAFLELTNSLNGCFKIYENLRSTKFYLLLKIPLEPLAFCYSSKLKCEATVILELLTY